jgi:hypothetical protein
MLSRLLLVAVTCVLPFVAFAERESTNYLVPSDVQPSGGGDARASDNYFLSDTIGEGGIGESESAAYSLTAGYRQADDGYLTMTCASTINLSIGGVGQSTSDATCTITTNVPSGYSLSWSVPTGSGGTATGSLINETEDTVAPYSPAVNGTPETWSVASNAAEWGGRLRSTSDDTDIIWGTDGVSEKWLNVSTGSTVIVQRTSANAPGGSDQHIHIRAEIGASTLRPSGTYSGVIVVTAITL